MKSHPNYDSPEMPQFVPVYVLTREQMRQGGIQVEQRGDGSVEFSAIVEPCNYFNSDFCMDMVRKYGERQAELMLDRVGGMMNNEIFMANFRRMLDQR